MKDTRLENIGGINEVESKLWAAFDLLRGAVPLGDSHFVLFLLSICRHGYLNEIQPVRPEELLLSIEGRLHNRSALHSSEYLSVYEAFRPALKEISPQTLRSIVDLLLSLNLDVLQEDFAKVFDSILVNFAKSRGLAGPGMMQPIELSRLVCNLAGSLEGKSIFNPFAGVVSFALCQNGYRSYYGQEVNFTTWALGKLRLLAYDRASSVTFSKENSLYNWPSDGHTFDVILSLPLFGMRINDAYHMQRQYRTVEQFLIDRGIHSLSPKGKLIAVLPMGFLFKGGEDARMRQMLVEQDLVEAVIALPSGIMFSTSIPVAVLVLNKAKVNRGEILFIDGRSFAEVEGHREKRLDDAALIALFQSKADSSLIRNVSLETIAANVFNLNLAHYFQKEYEGVLLGEVATIIRGQRTGDSETGKIVKVRDLKDDKLDFRLDLTEIEEVKVPRQMTKIAGSCLLVAVRWKSLKPTLFEYLDTPLYIPPDIVALKIDELRADVGYLVSELGADYVIEQADNIRVGAVIPSIRREDLLKIRIQLPDLLEMQQAKLRGLAQAYAEMKTAELQNFARIHGLEKEIYEQNTYLRHTLAGPTSNLVSSIANIKAIVLQEIVPALPGIMQQKVSTNHRLTLADYFEIVERDVQKIESAVRRQLKVETEIARKQKTPVDIIGFLKIYVAEKSENKALDYALEFDYDNDAFLGESGEELRVCVLANEELLRDLFNNLIDNAVAHAFPGTDDRRIEIFLMKTDDSPEVQLLISNTGNALPEDFTLANFTRKGFKSGINAGEGFGGWYINEIIRYFDGRLDYIDETSSEGLPGTKLAASFEISLPIIEVDENV